MLTGTITSFPAFALALPTAITGIPTKSATTVISAVTVVADVTLFPSSSSQPLNTYPSRTGATGRVPIAVPSATCICV